LAGVWWAQDHVYDPESKAICCLRQHDEEDTKKMAMTD
jgi:hypothetical protein